MINKWKSLTQDNQVKLTIFILGVILIPVMGFYGKSWFQSSSTPQTNTASQDGIIQTNQSEKNIVNTGSGTINIGLAPEQSDQRPNQNEPNAKPEAGDKIYQEINGDNGISIGVSHGVINIGASGNKSKDKKP